LRPQDGRPTPVPALAWRRGRTSDDARHPVKVCLRRQRLALSMGDGGQGLENFQEEGIECRRADLRRGQPGYKYGYGVHRVDGRFELLGTEQAPGGDDQGKPVSQL
jgi:hypothetical protein